jgi:hypothetical protein
MTLIYWGIGLIGGGLIAQVISLIAGVGVAALKDQEGYALAGLAFYFLSWCAMVVGFVLLALGIVQEVF